MSSSPIPDDLALVVSAEHAGREIPTWASMLAVPEDVLGSHRGHDPGTLSLARDLAEAFGAPLVVNLITRLLVDANRSARSRSRLSEFSRGLPEEVSERAISEIWAAHRSGVEEAVREELARGRRVVHVSVHSFTPVLDGRERRVDVGFLYDPSRPFERGVARLWRDQLHEARADLRLRLNAPYRGTADGLTTALRTVFGGRPYAGIECEVSQRFPGRGGRSWPGLRRDLVQSLRAALVALGPEPRP